MLLILFAFFSLDAFDQEGIASWYGGKFQGRKTANGEIFDTNDMTAAHKSLPFDTLVRVRNLSNGKETVVRINDRGPFVDDRIIDLSYEAARRLDMIQSGTAPVVIATIDPNVEPLIPRGPLTFTIQIGSYSNLENALAMKKRLTEAGYSPVAELSNRGTTRIMLKEIGQEECYDTVNSLEGLGFRGMLIKQDSL